jgi:hypothetical protein
MYVQSCAVPLAPSADVGLADDAVITSARRAGAAAIEQQQQLTSRLQQRG